MGIGSMNVTVKIKNMDKFIELSKEFNKKVRELEELAHELKALAYIAEKVDDQHEKIAFLQGSVDGLKLRFRQVESEKDLRERQENLDS